MKDHEVEEAIELQVLLKAEQAEIACDDETLPVLVELAKSVGAPFTHWQFIVDGDKIGAIEEA